MSWTYLFITTGDVHESLIEVRGRQYHHLVRVRRLTVGAALRAALPDGRVLHAEVIEITPELLRARITGEEAAVGVSPCRITLYQAVLKGERMELVVQKATELGVQTLVPLLTSRSIPRWSPTQTLQRIERWQRIADAACEQCERSIPLAVELPQTIGETLYNSLTAHFILHERAGQSLKSIAEQFSPIKDLGLYVGPEGGWTEEESQILLQARVTPVHLGGRILRAETASITAVALFQYLWGDLGDGSLEG